jgi:tRNA 2-thiocytidine biosynthesis protein TtcA
VVIRPLAYCRETDLELWAAQRQYPIIPCDLCGSQPNLQRQQVKEMLRDWDKRFPGRVNNLFRGLANVVPSHLLDTNLYDFRGLAADGVANPDGDRGFDPLSFPAVMPENSLQSFQALAVLD